MVTGARLTSQMSEEDKRKAFKKRKRAANKVAIEATTGQSLKRQKNVNEQAAVASSSSTKPAPPTAEALTVMNESEYGLKIRNHSIYCKMCMSSMSTTLILKHVRECWFGITNESMWTPSRLA